jgi:hypothetical protein
VEVGYVRGTVDGGDTMSGIILDLCGGTGSWSKPYTEAGYDVRLVTLPKHDVRLYEPPENVHGILAAPPCVHFSYAKHFHGKGNYSHDFKEGLSIVDACLRIVMVSKPQWWCLENPRGYITRWIGEPVEKFDPYEYGANYQKRTYLWGDFRMPQRTVLEKPDGVIKFSMLKSSEIAPEYYGILGRAERRGVTPREFAQAFFWANP